MSVRTNNIYGKILISDRAIENFVAKISMDCYGIVDFVPINFINSVSCFLKLSSNKKGVKVHSSGDRIIIDVAIIVKYGVSIKAVVDALKESLKYKVERFTGMIVENINVTVVGVQA